MVEMLSTLQETSPEGITIGLEYARLIREFMPEELGQFDELRILVEQLENTTDKEVVEIFGELLTLAVNNNFDEKLEKHFWGHWLEENNVL